MALTKTQKMEQEIKQGVIDKLFAGVDNVFQIGATAFALPVQVEGKERFLKITFVLAKDGYDVEQAVEDFTETVADRVKREKEAQEKKDKKLAEIAKKKEKKEGKEGK